MINMMELKKLSFVAEEFGGLAVMQCLALATGRYGYEVFSGLLTVVSSFGLYTLYFHPRK